MSEGGREEDLISGPLAEALRRGRERFNTAFFVARQSSPGLDETAFARHLRTLAPVADAVACHGPACLDVAIAALYDLLLDLFARGILSDAARSDLLGRVITELLPPLHAFLAESPHETAGKLVNAALQLGATPGARSAEWMNLLVRIVPKVSARGELFDAGRVLAWRCGMAHQRTAALRAAERLSEQVLFSALDVPPAVPGGSVSPAELLRALAADPWLHPAHVADGTAGRSKELRLVADAGGFRGFGGPFLAPPRACVADGEIVLSDAGQDWQMHADVFGVVFSKIYFDICNGGRRPGTAKQAMRDEIHDVTVAADGTISWNGLKTRCDRLAYPTGVVCDGTTVVVTLRYSHRVLLFARTAAFPGDAGRGE
ncbi:hypothetical protein KBA41_01765 [Candidatus Ozemobacteraceae bacterium]|nr:hypothetical protein [Candidatus Ozemobacteraceae bacterium]